MPQFGDIFVGNLRVVGCWQTASSAVFGQESVLQIDVGLSYDVIAAKEIVIPHGDVQVFVHRQECLDLEHPG